MTTDYNLEFLKNKISQTGSALCSFHLQGFTKNSYIIHTNSVDDNGNISFSLIDSFPAVTKADLQSFGIKLFFFRKGLGYHLNIEALATVTTTPVKEDMSCDDSKNMLFITAKILSAEYTEGRDRLVHPGFLYNVRKKISQVAAGIFWI
ncbi:MAG: hypothetical protein V4717_23015 [Bacteroidota bacterium]